MKKYFIVADVHGFYDEMMEALNSKGFDINNPDHIFVSLGDAFDRGKQARDMLDFLTSLPKENRIFILGNHELLMEQAINRGWFKYHDMTNGTKGTAYQLAEANHDEEAIDFLKSDWQWNEYIRDCRFYAEIGNNIFVHGWIPFRQFGGYSPDGFAYDPEWRDYPAHDWKEATWTNGMNAWNFGIREPGKTIWCGHWHTSWGHAHLHGKGVEFINREYDYEAFGITPVVHYEPFKDDGIVAMDACTVLSHKVNCEVIEIEGE